MKRLQLDAATNLAEPQEPLLLQGFCAGAAGSLTSTSHSIITVAPLPHDCYRQKLMTATMCAAAPQLLATRPGSLALRPAERQVVIMQGSR